MLKIEKPNILIVDDNPANILSIEKTIRSNDYNIITANSGNEALACVLEYDFALILLDVQMPQMDGFETARFIKSNSDTHHIPIIFITAINKEKKHVFEGYNAGAVDYLFKPIDPHILSSKVNIFIELYKNKKEIERYAKTLIRSNKDLEQFAYIASHDLQEPLRTISVYIQLIEKKIKEQLDEDCLSFMGRTVKAVDRMRNMINGILDFARISNQAKPFAPFSIETLLHSALNNLNHLIKDKDAIITNDNYFPEIICDDTQITIVFQNLISNALKFCDKEPPRIHISAKQGKGEWIFCVKDNGIGINEAYYEKIFDIFRILHGNSKYQGTGIGLSLCKRIVERHGGRIWVVSEFGVGSEFYFSIKNS
ncbi:MAG: response regulator [Desulfobacterales bacterium]|nr:response regulator [Desulfobacterales bacterium]